MLTVAVNIKIRDRCPSPLNRPRYTDSLYGRQLCTRGTRVLVFETGNERHCHGGALDDIFFFFLLFPSLLEDATVEIRTKAGERESTIHEKDFLCIISGN